MTLPTAKMVAIFMVVLLLQAMPLAYAGPVAWAACQTAGNAGAVACYSASGLVFGAAGPVGWWAWLTGAAPTCSAIQGACMAACTPLLLAPTP